MTSARLCPICNRPVPDAEDARRFKPFCSKRCADVDLGRWLKGGYAIPATETGDESEAEPEQGPEPGLEPDEGGGPMPPNPRLRN